MHNTTMWKGKKTFEGRLNEMYDLYLNQDGVQHSAKNSVLYLTMVRQKYMKMYERFIEELETYSKAIMILSNGYLQFIHCHHQN